jgi:hypothetical protein
LFLLLAPNAYIETARAISQYLVLPMHKLFRTQLHFENQPHSSSTRAWSTCDSKINERGRRHNKNCFLARSHAQPRLVAPNAASLANYVLWLGLNFGAALAEARLRNIGLRPRALLSAPYGHLPKLALQPQAPYTSGIAPAEYVVVFVAAVVCCCCCCC